MTSVREVSRTGKIRTRKEPPPYLVTSVDHALRLAIMLQVEGPMRVSEAAERLGVARSTAHRLLSMLVYRDFAAQDEDKRYVAGPILVHGQARPVLSASRLRDVALPHMEVLARRTRETCNLMVLSGDRVRFIASAEGTYALRVSNREGAVFPAHQTSGGKAILAEMGEAERRELYDPRRFEGRTEELPDLAVLTRALRAVRSSGVAVNREETEDGVTAIGLPVRDRSGDVVAALSISMPTTRYRSAFLQEILPWLAAAVEDIRGDL